MNRRPSWLWRCAVVIAALGLGACNAGDLQPGEEETLGNSEAAVCTVCGTTRYTSTRYGEGSGCGTAATQARSLLASSMASRCPTGTCNVVQTLGECEPLGPSRLDGFRMDITATYSCCG